MAGRQAGRQTLSFDTSRQKRLLIAWELGIHGGLDIDLCLFSTGASWCFSGSWAAVVHVEYIRLDLGRPVVQYTSRCCARRDAPKLRHVAARRNWHAVVSRSSQVRAW